MKKKQSADRDLPGDLAGAERQAGAQYRTGLASGEFDGPVKVPSSTVLRFVAILLIANSHLDALYPISSLATGGSIGNALFFMLSGYGLFLSAIIRPGPFLTWYGRRIVRIYPALWIASILIALVAQSAWRSLDWLGYVQMFVWPTRYWFVAALMIFYMLFFVMLRLHDSRYFLAVIAVLYVPYLYFYITGLDLSGYAIEGEGYFKWLFYLQTMFFGGYLAGRKTLGRLSLWKDGLALILFVALHYGSLSAMNRFGGWEFQIVSHLLMFPTLFFFLRLASNERIAALVQSRYLGTAVSLVAGATLEIYLLHGYVRELPFMLETVFPLNLLAFWIVTILLSYVLNRVSRLIVQGVTFALQKVERPT